MTAPTSREELLALAARLVIASDILTRHPCEVVRLQQDCLAAAELLRAGVAATPPSGAIAWTGLVPAGKNERMREWDFGPPPDDAQEVQLLYTTVSWPVAWRWRTIPSDDAWNYQASKPVATNLEIQPLYAAAQPCFDNTGDGK